MLASPSRPVRKNYRPPLCINCTHSPYRYGQAGVNNWELLWVPLAPLACCACCAYVSYSLESTARALSRLRALRYRHHKV